MSLGHKCLGIERFILFLRSYIQYRPKHIPLSVRGMHVYIVSCGKIGRKICGLIRSLVRSFALFCKALKGHCCEAGNKALNKRNDPEHTSRN